MHQNSPCRQLFTSVVQSPFTGVISSSLVCSRTGVAPLKPLTIYKLELTAALLLAQLMSYVQATLKATFGLLICGRTQNALSRGFDLIPHDGLITLEIEYQ